VSSAFPQRHERRSAGLGLITFVCFQFGFGLARTAFAYVIVIALASLLGSFTVSVVLSIVAVACLDNFFASPLFAMGVDAPDDIVRIATFLTTALVVTGLTEIPEWQMGIEHLAVLAPSLGAMPGDIGPFLVWQ